MCTDSITVHIVLSQEQLFLFELEIRNFFSGSQKGCHNITSVPCNIMKILQMFTFKILINVCD